MLRLSRAALAIVVLAASAVAAGAQQPLQLEIRNGQVTLEAQNIPLRAILTEWARVGGTSVIGAERLAGPPVTVELTRVPERQALEILLRNTSGYMLALRPAGIQGASAYNRILIMPPSTAPRALSTPAVAAAPRLPVPEPDDADEEPQDVTLQGPVAAPRPGAPVRLPTVSGQNTPVVITQPPAPLPVPEAGTPGSSSPGVVVISPSNPFGMPAGSSAQPGTISPVPPAPPQPRTDPD